MKDIGNPLYVEMCWNKPAVIVHVLNRIRKQYWVQWILKQNR